MTLTGRLIDHPLRPLFPSWLRDDIQVVATTVSMDERATGRFGGDGGFGGDTAGENAVLRADGGNATGL